MRNLLFILLIGLTPGGAMRAAEGSGDTGPGLGPPQFQIEIRVVEMDATDSKPLGFDWFMGQRSGNGTAPAWNQGPTNRMSQLPGQPVATLSGILTDPQFRTVVRSLEQRSNTKLLASVEGTALAGTKMEVRQPDGWGFRVMPMPGPRDGTGGTFLDVEIEKKSGDYAGFSWSSRGRTANGESLVFRSVFTPAEKNKKSKGPEKTALMIFVTATGNSSETSRE